MRSIRMTTGLALGALMILSACADKEPNLMNIRSDTPDEFSILPTKPLEDPEDYDTLPTPTPGGTNRADVNPYADAAVALGGTETAVTSSGTTASERVLVAHAGRYGATPDIREVVAAEDLEYRRENNGRLLERLFNVNVYNKSYSEQELDQHLELDRLRARNLPTPSAPPDPLRTFDQ